MTILTCLGDSITDCEHCFSRDFLGNGLELVAVWRRMDVRAYLDPL